MPETDLAALTPAVGTLALRRSPQPDALVAPGPNAAEIDRLVEIALRVPDHGRLSPWRLLLVAGEAKARWVDRLMQLAETREDAAKVKVSTRKLATPPLVVVVVSRAVPGHKVPEWEQWLSAGAVCMNVLNGAHALGYGANWLTGWHAYDPRATELLKLAEGEKVAGVILVGSIAEAPPRAPGLRRIRSPAGWNCDLQPRRLSALIVTSVSKPCRRSPPCAE